MKDIYLKFLEQYYRISNTIIRFQNIPLSFNGSIPLRPASIHLIDEIQNHPDANMTEIAQNLGITKGAVSQMVKELEGKGLVKRQRSDRDGRAMHFKLTRAGKKVYDAMRRSSTISTSAWKKNSNRTRSMKSLTSKRSYR